MAKRTTKKELKLPADYYALQDTTRIMGEDNDCAVKAVALAANVSYLDSHTALKAQGRKNKTGTQFYQTTEAMDTLGFKLTPIPKQKFISQYPGKHKLKKGITTFQVARFNKVFNDGNTYFFRTRRHILTVRDGVCLDFTAKQSKQVLEIYLVTKK